MIPQELKKYINKAIKTANFILRGYGFQGTHLSTLISLLRVSVKGQLKDEYIKNKAIKINNDLKEINCSFMDVIKCKKEEMHRFNLIVLIQLSQSIAKRANPLPLNPSALTPRTKRIITAITPLTLHHNSIFKGFKGTPSYGRSQGQI